MRRALVVVAVVVVVTVAMLGTAGAVPFGVVPAYAAGLEEKVGRAAAASGTTQEPAQGARPAPVDDPDLDLNPLQPDFALINLPTTLRLAQHKMAFRVTHRFGRPLGAGTFGDLASDFFGLDNGAQIGLELRYGLMRGTQIGIYRTSNRTIEFFGQQNVLKQDSSHPIGLGIIATVEGTNNFRDEYSPSIGFALSREVKGVGAFYVEPMWVGNVNIFESRIVADDNAILFGLGARIRVRPTVYLVGEFAPRVTGYDAGVHHGTFGIEKRAGGHSFQLNFSDGIGSSIGQIARGGTSSKDWYIGFNISRKFF